MGLALHGRQPERLSSRRARGRSTSVGHSQTKERHESPSTVRPSYPRAARYNPDEHLRTRDRCRGRQGNDDLSTLAGALEAAGLAETLSGEGPFTVFAPTNEAFAALPEGELERLLASPDELERVLSYHVVPERLLEQRCGEVIDDSQRRPARAGDA